MARLALLSGKLFHCVHGSCRDGRLVGREKGLFHGRERDQSRIIAPNGRWDHARGFPSGPGHASALQGAATVTGAIGRELVGIAHGVTAIGHEREHDGRLFSEGEGLVGLGVWASHILDVLVPARRAGFL